MHYLKAAWWELDHTGKWSKISLKEAPECRKRLGCQTFFAVQAYDDTYHGQSVLYNLFFLAFCFVATMAKHFNTQNVFLFMNKI